MRSSCHPVIVDPRLLASRLESLLGPRHDHDGKTGGRGGSVDTECMWRWTGAQGPITFALPTGHRVDVVNGSYNPMGT